MKRVMLDSVNEKDRVIGTETKETILRKKLGFRVAHVLITNGEGKLLLQKLPLQHKRFPGYWGSSAAGFVHADESYEQAAKRILKRELGIAKIPLQKVGKVMMKDNGNTKFITLFSGTWDGKLVMDPAHEQGLEFVKIKHGKTILIPPGHRWTSSFRTVFGLYEEWVTKKGRKK